MEFNLSTNCGISREFEILILGFKGVDWVIF
jgi:hypothetical protein